MIKTNIKMRVTPEQSRKVQEICFENGIIWTHKINKLTNLHLPYLYIDSLMGIYATLDIECYEEHTEYEEIDADLFIKTNGTCEETYLTKYTSQPKDLESALKKIENLHIALNKKREKNKNQALEITKLLEQKKKISDELNMSLTERNIALNQYQDIRYDITEKEKQIERLNSIVEYLSKQLGLKVF